MPVLMTAPMIGGGSRPVDGEVAAAPTDAFTANGVVVQAVPQAGVVRGGQFYSASGQGAFEIPATPEGVGMRLVLRLVDDSKPERRRVVIERVVQVPNTATVQWADLIDIVPPTTGDYVVPGWAADAIEAGAVAAAAVTATAAARDTAVAAAAAAQAVPTTTDGIVQNLVQTSSQTRTAMDTRYRAQATTAAQGIIEVATTTEASAGVDTARAVTPAGLAAFELLKRPARPNAVFVGASNVSAWAVTLCAAEGWTRRDFSVGSTLVSTGEWETQLDQAIASAAFDNATVGTVWIAGGGNDARPVAPAVAPSLVQSKTNDLIVKAKAAFPGARIIVVPGLWNRGGVIPNLLPVTMAMRQAALDRQVEVIDQAWTWLIGYGPEYMLADEVHPSALGYDVFLSYIRLYLRGGSTGVNRAEIGSSLMRTGFTEHANGYASVVCVDGMVTFQAWVQKTSGNFAANDLPMTLPLWATIGQGTKSRPISGHLGAGLGTVALTIRNLSVAVPVSLLSLGGAASNELRIPPHTWPLGQ